MYLTNCLCRYATLMLLLQPTTGPPAFPSAAATPVLPAVLAEGTKFCNAEQGRLVIPESSLAAALALPKRSYRSED